MNGDTSPRPSRAVLTLAVGKPVYQAMAANLARSILHWHRDGEVPVYVATDAPDRLPADLRGRVRVLPVAPGQYGEGFSPKLHLDRISPALTTLFIDADCLCVGSLRPVFDRLAGRPVAVVGTRISSGEWFGDVGAVCRAFGLASLPKFNGGLYYLERGAASEAVYAAARALEARYDALGLVRLRGRPNDELLMAIAMAQAGLTAVRDDGTIMADPQAFPGPVRIDVLGGGAELHNPPGPHARHVPSNPLRSARPVIVHFLGHHTETHPYTREELRLALHGVQRWPVPAADLAAMLRRTIPSEGRRVAKDLLRPAYRRLVGTRAPSASPRV